MGIKNAGKDFSLEDNNKILEINSPRKSIKGPYIVVHKNLPDRWAIVAMDWDGKPHLGIRWFWGGGGNPISTGFAVWFVLPTSLSRNMLSGLPLTHEFSAKIDDFLAGKITGTELRQL